ncbi:MAG: DUF3124 domain-containing protein [Geobacteraceae bacterium]|nr:DUF3124 domain-containing protein [Geobacteraceae bacterium]
MMWYRNLLMASIPIAMLSLLCLVIPEKSLASETGIRLSKGQTVYVPAYSNVFTGPKKLPFQLATTLSVRSTDLAAPIRITSIEYYDTNGRMIRRYLDKPLNLGPLASTFVHIEEKDASGGFGANFIVRWNADRVVNAPVIECVMIGATSGQGISFVSPGQEIRE